MLDPKTIAALLMLILPAYACSDDDKADASDTQVPDATSAPDTAEIDGTPDLQDGETEVTCCPIAPPSCDCFETGGSGHCSSLCDAPPVGWVLVTDENGCPEWTGGAPGSCLIDPFDGDTNDPFDGDTGNPDGSDGDITEPDGDITEPDGDLGLRFELAGSIQIVEAYSEGFGGVAGSWVYADLHDKVAPATYTLAAEAGACQVFARSDQLCEPACDEGQTCNAVAVCEVQAAPTNAGDLTITGLAVSPLTARAGEFGYIFSPEPPADGLFDAGDTITVTAAGGPLPAFTTTVRGVADFGLQNEGMVELVDGKDTILNWKPASGDSSDEVEVVLQLGWHGAPPTGVIVCRASDSVGTIVIPAAVIAKFPLFGGLGLFQNPSWAERISRSLVTTSAGLIEVTASSRASVGVSHTSE